MGSVTFEKLVGLMAAALVLIGSYNTVLPAICGRDENAYRKVVVK